MRNVPGRYLNQKPPNETKKSRHSIITQIYQILVLGNLVLRNVGKQVHHNMSTSNGKQR